jgi:hypothetical protein
MEWHTIIPLMITSDGVKPPKNQWPAESILLSEQWWNERIWLEGEFALSRKDIVLSAANQDGGAHVDANPNANTRKIKIGPSVTVKINGQPVENGFVNHHYPLVRQFAYEVLESKDLHRLAHGA